MNYRSVLFLLGRLQLVLALTLLVPAIAGYFSGDAHYQAFLVLAAFVGLVGRATQIPAGDMDDFADFALTITLPPNPVRALDNSLTPDQQAGSDFFHGPRRSDGLADDVGAEPARGARHHSPGIAVGGDVSGVEEPARGRREHPPRIVRIGADPLHLSHARPTGGPEVLAGVAAAHDAVPGRHVDPTARGTDHDLIRDDVVIRLDLTAQPKTRAP